MLVSMVHSDMSSLSGRRCRERVEDRTVGGGGRGRGMGPSSGRFVDLAVMDHPKRERLGRSAMSSSMSSSSSNQLSCDMMVLCSSNSRCSSYCISCSINSCNSSKCCNCNSCSRSCKSSRYCSSSCCRRWCGNDLFVHCILLLDKKSSSMCQIKMSLYCCRVGNGMTLIDTTK